MSSESSAKNLMAYSFLVVFANDRTIDEREIAMLEKLALQDGIVDEDEKRVLRNIFSRVNEDTVKPEVWAEITKFRKEYGI